MGCLPVGPDLVDHRVMHPEQRIGGSRWDVRHRAVTPNMNGAVQRVQLIHQVREATYSHEGVYLRRSRQRWRGGWIPSDSDVWTNHLDGRLEAYHPRRHGAVRS